MLRLGNAVGNRAYALIAALTDREITLREFLDEVEPLTAEEVQVIATMLFDFTECDGDARQKLARDYCLRWASGLRTLC